MKKFLSGLKHYFIPSTHNNYRARILHLDFLFLFFAMSLLFSSAYNHPQTGIVAQDVLGIATNIKVEKLVQDTNIERQNVGLNPLQYDETLAKAAAKKAKDMFANNYWAHYSPTGRSPWSFMVDEGYKYEYAGENLARDFMYSDDVVKAWMESPSHKENLLKKEYTNIGFAIVDGKLGGEDTTLVVQMFAKPAVGYVASTQKTHIVTEGTSSKVLSTESLPKTTLKTFSFNMTYAFFIILSIVLLMDLYYAKRLNLIRMTGKNIAHLIFILFIVASLIVFAKGFII